MGREAHLEERSGTLLGARSSRPSLWLALACQLV